MLDEGYFTCTNCQSPCVSSNQSRDPYRIIEQYGAGVPAARACCYHPDAQIQLYLVHRVTNIGAGTWTEYRFNGYGVFDQPMVGSYDVALSNGQVTTTQATTTVNRRFEHTAFGVFDRAVVNAVAHYQSGGTNSGSATELCSGYRGSYSSSDGSTLRTLTVMAEVISRGGQGCCGPIDPGGNSNNTPITGGEYRPYGNVVGD